MAATGVSEDLLAEGPHLYCKGIGWICQYECYWGELYWSRNLPYFLRDLALERLNYEPSLQLQKLVSSLNSDILLLEKHAS